MSVGAGIVNTLISKLPVELHLPGYNYCGPGTKLRERLSRGDPGINPLDEACKQHDISYSKSKEVCERHKADKVLEHRAWERVKAQDASLGEKSAAWLVTNVMKAKQRFGMGLKKKKRGAGRIPRQPKVAFRASVVRKAREMMKNSQVKDDLEKAARVALAAAKASVRVSGGKNRIQTPRVIPVGRRGGFLPLIPLLSGLSAIGGLSGGVAGIVKAYKDIKRGQTALEEAKRHNRTMEAIALGKRGGGLFLQPHRKGLGLYLRQPKNF